MNLTKSLCLALYCLALWSSSALAQGGVWEASTRAGEQAYRQGRYSEAERSFQAALKEAEQFGPEDPRVARTLNNLALLYDAQHRYAEAEPLLQRALAIQAKALGPAHPDVALSLSTT